MSPVNVLLQVLRWMQRQAKHHMVSSSLPCVKKMSIWRCLVIPTISTSSNSTKCEPIISKEIVDFAATSAFEGLSKQTRKAMAQETPVPLHDDLRLKKVDSFVKKFLKHKRTTFNPVMDHRQLNLAGHIHLAQRAISLLLPYITITSNI